MSPYECTTNIDIFPLIQQQLQCCPSIPGPTGAPGKSITGPTGAQGESITGPTGPPGIDIDLDGCGAGAIGQPGPPFEGDLLQWRESQSAWVTEPGRWNDLRIPLTATRGGGVREPSFEVFRTDGVGSLGVFLYFFSHNQQQELFFSAQLDHSYDEGTDLEPHLHVTMKSVATGTAKWGLEYTFANVNDVFPTTSTNTGSITIVAGDQYRHKIVGLGTISGASLKISSMVNCRIYRDVSDPGDTLNDEMGLMEVDFHYQMCGNGSTQTFIK